MSAALRARPEDLLARFPLRLVPPASGQLACREVEVCGYAAQLTVERVGQARIRATVSMGRPALSLGREVAAAAHALAREAVEAYGRAESAGIWGVGFTVEGVEA